MELTEAFINQWVQSALETKRVKVLKAPQNVANDFKQSMSEVMELVQQLTKLELPSELVQQFAKAYKADEELRREVATWTSSGIKKEVPMTPAEQAYLEDLRTHLIGVSKTTEMYKAELESNSDETGDPTEM